MNLLKRLLLAAACAALWCAALAPAAAQRRRPERVDLLVAGGTVVTMDRERRVIEAGAVAVRGGRIVAVGTRAEVERRYA
ncbi:MAG: hypothetical protein M3416_17690, partial [Acidobacteriota bacterium]|nr:hypothetical protein [Acidobacteriota bacterium]